MEVLEELVTEIGTYPDAWSIDRVDSVFDLIQGKQVSERKRAGDNQRPFLRTRNVFWDRLDLGDLDKMHFTEAEETRYTLLPGDLLLCEGGDVGRTAMWRGEVERCYIQNHLHRLRALDGMVDPQYGVYWFWYAFQIGNLYIGRGNKTTIPNMSRSKLAELQIALPPFKEQQRIAQVLSTVQQAIEQQERLIRTTTELKQAFMQKLFTEGLRGEAQKETEIGLVPESWEVSAIGVEAAVTKLAGYEYTKHIKYTDEGEIIAVRGMNLKDGKLDLTEVKRIWRDVSDALPRSQLHPGDVLLSYVGTVGSVALIAEDGKFHLAPNVAKLTSKDLKRLLPEYLLVYLRSDAGRSDLFRSVSKTSQPVISMARIRSLHLPLPSVDEQLDIVNTLGAVDGKLDAANRKRNAFQDLFRTLLHELMTGKVRVGEMKAAHA